ncbi:MAG: methyl-accepting chemotaxis protein, partial [Candidatus Edwardsbacteria bacterium]|nr:methyl-accepting chemotaxis protein [Candidatus Edwardsbacteria bacterium]
YPTIRGLQIFGEFLVGAPIVVLLLMLFGTGTSLTQLADIAFPSFITALVTGSMVFLSVEYQVRPLIAYLTMTETVSHDAVIVRALRISLSYRLIVLFLVVMLLSFVFGIMITRYPGIFWVAIIGLASTLFIAYMTARGINGSVRLVSGMLRDIAQGEGGITRRLPILSNDELGDLCLAYNQFMEKFRRLVEDVTKAAAELAANSQQLAASSQEMNASAQEISSTIQQISRGASIQSERLTQVAKEVEKLSSSFKQMDSLGRMTNVSSQKSIEASKHGAQNTTEIVGKMAEIYQSSAWATQQVQGLQQKSKEIGKVSNLISNIAQQTDFLALNAAIEAARAGEAGKGFSVVADEIRSLAVEAGSSAEQVTSLIRDIEQEITRTVEGITQSQQIIETGKTAVDQTEHSLKVINSTVAVAGTMVKQMAEASRHQSESAGHVVTLASEVSTISIETASSTEEVAAAVEEQTASMEELSALSQTLSHTAEGLSALVKRFRSDQEG